MKSFRRTISMVALAALFAVPVGANAQAPASTENGKTITIKGSDISQTVEATGNEDINIIGAGSRIVVTGTCNSITVKGADVKVQADGVRIIRVQGADSGVTYKFSPNKNGKAISRISGADSYVRKIR